MFGCFIKLCFLLRQVFMSKMLDQYQGNEKQRWHHSIKQTSNLPQQSVFLQPLILFATKHKPQQQQRPTNTQIPITAIPIDEPIKFCRQYISCWSKYMPRGQAHSPTMLAKSPPNHALWNMKNMIIVIDKH